MEMREESPSVGDHDLLVLVLSSTPTVGVECRKMADFMHQKARKEDAGGLGAKCATTVAVWRCDVMEGVWMQCSM